VYVLSEYPHIHIHIKLIIHVHVASGEVFTWGSGSYGRLGHGNMRDRFSPLMIGGILRGVGITFVACHEFHSVAVAGERKRGRGRHDENGREGERVRGGGGD
jgi:alpha-tubulin suppressor-like RCC1 family protein